MRRILLVLVLLAGCKKSAPTEHIELPAATGPVAPQPAAPAAPVAAEPTAPATAPVVADRATPPTSDEVLAQLRPLFGELKSCVSSQRVLDAGLRLELHVRIEPAGEVLDAKIVGLPAADSCVLDTMKKLRLPAWRGAPTLVALSLTSTGEPLRIPVDGG